MKRIVFSAIITSLLTTTAGAQAVYDTVITNPTYANNVWYSLANDDQATSAANSWDIGLSTSMGAMDELTTAVLFNHKMGTVYEIPDSDPLDFENADTAGLSTWTPLYNSDQTWADGAFNNTSNLGSFDYGWGNYNMSTHGIDANRVFVIKYTSGEYRKLKINSANPSNTYTLVFATLDNATLNTVNVDITAYSAKNFVYYNLISNAIVDREPATANWDLYFHQYPSFDYNPPYTVTGIFQNTGVEVAKVYPVNDPATYMDFSGEEFSPVISTIGYSWKAFNGMSFVVVDSTVFFVQDKAGDVWKVIMTGFGGSSTGKYMFSKELISEAGTEDVKPVLMAVYPNPASDNVTLVLDNATDAIVSLYDMSGTLVYSQNTEAEQLTAKTLSLAGFSNGMYRVVVQTSTSVNTQQLLIQH